MGKESSDNVKMAEKNNLINLKTAIFGIQVSLIAIAVNLIGIVISNNYSQTHKIVQIISSIVLICVAFILIFLVFKINLNKRKKKINKLLEIASHETLYDSIKWVAFAIFVVIYFGLKEKNTLTAIGFIILFVLVLFIINIFKQKGLKNIKELLAQQT